MVRCGYRLEPVDLGRQKPTSLHKIVDRVEEPPGLAGQRLVHQWERSLRLAPAERRLDERQRGCGEDAAAVLGCVVLDGEAPVFDLMATFSSDEVGS